jgi:hypothetical protein
MLMPRQRFRLNKHQLVTRSCGRRSPSDLIVIGLLLMSEKSKCRVYFSDGKVRRRVGGEQRGNLQSHICTFESVSLKRHIISFSASLRLG